ncbi:CDP-alcohol phosphatidyltransferase family protein [Micromonospora sp. URMC 103]|uniref:CDP-alcohol phosphatidyltransferase family protein n=1 Tax=Micromonospora sp. URMC 103 TaxID=3423406 RepID=UPI003F1E01B9
MGTVRTGPWVGLAAQVVLLAVLAGTVGVGGAGWLAGAGYGVVSGVALARGLRRAGSRRLGPADRVTLGRSVLVGAVAALVADGLAGRPAPVALLVTLAAVALALDAVDGRVARRTGTASALGARFDMEVDAFLLLVLSARVAPAAGAWVLAIGGMRYAFVAAGWALPWMRGTLPPRLWRKVVAATQGVVLAAAVVLPAAPATLLLGVALALLVESFGRDVLWLWRHRPLRPRTRPTGSPVRPVPPAAGTPDRPPALAGSGARVERWGH